jgi:excinuclease ABC subunit C
MKRPSDLLQERLAQLPTNPGIYLFKCADQVIYVGKAKRLNKRVKQYFLKQHQDAKTQLLVSQIETLEWIITQTEAEALILECDLIKRYQPKYNILLKDDKTYPYIHINTEHDFPGVYYFRGKTRLNKDYYGPYTDMRALRETLDHIQHIFQLRTCTNSYFSNRSRACILYQINRCSGPCVGHIQADAYQKQVEDVQRFLRGESSEIIEALEGRMKDAVQALEYEQAAVIRDQIYALRQIQHQQEITGTTENLDVFHFDFALPAVYGYYLAVRQGKMKTHRFYTWSSIYTDEISESLTTLLLQFYAQGTAGRISHVLTNIKPSNKAMLEQLLQEKCGYPIHILHQPKADKEQWLQVAKTNCLHHQQQAIEPVEVLNALQSMLGMTTLPQRIECFDISHTSGCQAVGACVVFMNGKPDTRQYRYYDVSPASPGDDYEAMRIALTKRYADKHSDLASLPQLIIIDGGKGQLQAAVETLADAQLLSLTTVISLSKGEKRKEGLETLHRHQLAPIAINQDVGCHKLLLRVRNAAHSYALRKHVKKRTKHSLKSLLLAIPGIGPKKRQALLQHYPSMESIQESTVSQLCKVPGIDKKLAAVIHAFLQESR